MYTHLQLESRLAEKEEQMLEKDLVLEQVQRMVDRIRDKAQAGKDDTLNLAKKVSFDERNRCSLEHLLFFTVATRNEKSTFFNT